MKCDMCGDRPAVIFVQQISKGSSLELHLCEECARERGFPTDENKVDISLGGILTGALDGSNQTFEKESACPSCGLTLSAIKRGRKAGCAECYKNFRGEIVAILRREGIEPSYGGPLPRTLAAFRSPRADAESLRRELKKAIEREDYELAAYYRDRIKASGAKPS